MLAPPRSPRFLAGTGFVVFWTLLLVAIGLPAVGLALPAGVAAFALGRAARDRWPPAFVLPSAPREHFHALAAFTRRSAALAHGRIEAAAVFVGTMRTARSRREAWELNRAAVDHRRAGRLEAAIACCEHALAVVKRVRDRRDEALTLNSLGLALAEAGDSDRASACFLRAAAILRDLEHPHLEGQVLANLGALRERQQQRDEALSCWREALELLETGSQEHERLLQRVGTPVET
jgi:tetratricopeptide (TPR) repeat protein